MDSLVKKRDGSIEPFNPQKIRNVLGAAGLEQGKIEIVIENVSDWIIKQKESPTSSLLIRDQVLTQLESIDPYIAGLFRWYEKSKEL